MARTARDQYFDNEVFTATPQKLHLMLIDAAIRLGNQTLEHWRQGRELQATEALVRCQRILAQMIKGLRPARLPKLVEQVARVYLFIYQSFVRAQLQHDPVKVTDALRVLEIERETWRKVCEQLGSNRPSASSIPAPHSNSVSSRLNLDA